MSLSELDHLVASAASLTALDQLASDSRTAAAHELPDLFNTYARELGATGGIAYLVDLQQRLLTPFLGTSALLDPDTAPPRSALGVDATLAGRVYQDLSHQLQTVGAETTLWLPLVAGTERLGVLAVGLTEPEPESDSFAAYQRLAVAAADILRARAAFGDTLLKAQRRYHLNTAAELQSSILPPLSFASRAVTISAALEPCYHVAGDAIDYAAGDARASVAVFDGMGHGLESAQCAVLTVAAYRAARRSGRSLAECFADIDEALTAGMQGEIFTTGILAELDTQTGSFRWMNAGHPPPLLIRGGQLVRTLETESRPPLGLGDLLDAPLDPEVEQLEPGDLILLYTDGVTEARSPTGEFFGVERLADLVIRHLAGGLAAPETLRRVVRELLAHHGDQLTDDATLLMLEWRSETTAPTYPLIRVPEA